MKLLVQRLFFFAVLCVSLSSCFKAGPGVIDPDDPMFFPQGGTSFIAVVRQMDSAGTVTNLSGDTINLVRKGLAINGKMNVSKFLRPGEYDPYYISYEPNGDISMGASSSIISSNVGSVSWVTMPVSSHVPKQYSWDTTLREGNVQKFYHHEAQYSYLGTETLRVNGRTYTVQKVRAFLTSRGQQSGEPAQQLSWYTDYSYAPEIGYFVKIEEPDLSIFDLPGSVTWELQEVVVK